MASVHPVRGKDKLATHIVPSTSNRGGCKLWIKVSRFCITSHQDAQSDQSRFISLLKHPDQSPHGFFGVSKACFVDGFLFFTETVQRFGDWRLNANPGFTIY